MAVKCLREQYPRWGKDKLAVLLGRQGLQVSVSMVGRILSHLKRTGRLVEPLRARVKTRKRARCRVYAVRKPKDYVAKEPGDIVQLDTMDVYPLPGVGLKHFTARDVISRWDVVAIRSRATSLAAKAMLEEVLERMPFPVKALQVDGGSEFMKEFEEECQAKGIALYILPPRSPKLNGQVERAHRTHLEEFYEVTEAEPTVAALKAELLAWEHIYNTVRPHQALGYKTPEEFLQATNHYQPRKEVLYGRC
jgi:transposase InsO family protein